MSALLVGVLYVSCGPLLWMSSDIAFRIQRKNKACKENPNLEMCYQEKICNWNAEDGGVEYCPTPSLKESK